MAAGEPRSLEHPDAAAQDPNSPPTVSGTSLAPGTGVAAGMVIPGLVSKDSLPAFVEMIKVDLSREWLQGRPVNVESYLESFPELGTVETVPAELILAEYEVRSRAGESVELAQFEQRFPHQAEALRKLIDQQTSEQATASMLGQLSETTARAHRVPLSPARDPKAAPTLPKRFGRYRVLEQLGQGAMGTVYLVRDTQLHRCVALKVPHVRPGDAQGPDRSSGTGPILPRGACRSDPPPSQPLPGIRCWSNRWDALPDHGVHQGTTALPVRRPQSAARPPMGGRFGAKARPGLAGGP